MSNNEKIIYLERSKIRYKRKFMQFVIAWKIKRLEKKEFKEKRKKEKIGE